MTQQIRIALVDDQELIRLGFRMVLEAEPDFCVVGEAANGRAGVAMVQEQRPDIVLMDVRMPELDGIGATAEIVASSPETKVIVLTTFDLDEYAFGALRAGASGFLLKDAERGELLGAIRAVHRGDAALAPRVTRALIDMVGTSAPAAGRDASGLDAAGFDGSGVGGLGVDLAGVDAAGLDQLTERERDVFLAIARGMTNQEIADTLFLSESTVKTHVGRVLAKLGARDRVAAVILAAGWGLTDQPDP